MLFCIFSCTNSVRQFILSAWLLKLLIVGTVEVKISLNLGKTANHKQRYRCHDCGKQSRQNPTVKYTEEQKEMTLRVYQER